MEISRKLGRPSLISRESILTAALEIAAAAPGGAVSISGVARHLNVTPMAIYTYFGSKDELLQALSKLLLDSLVIEVPADATLTDKITIWSHAVRRHFLQYPQLIHMLAWEGGHSSVAWLNQAKVLFDALDSLALDRETLAKTILSIWNMVTTTILFEIYDRNTPARITDEEFENLDPAVKPNVRLVRDFLLNEGQHDRYFAFQVARLIEFVVQLKSGAPILVDLPEGAHKAG